MVSAVRGLFLSKTHMKKLSKYLTPKIITALSLIIVSNLGWLIPISVIPWLDIDLERKALVSLSWVIFGQVSYNAGLLLVGADILKKFHQKKIKLQAIRIQFALFLRVLTKPGRWVKFFRT
jgi:hypothetical protein